MTLHPGCHRARDIARGERHNDVIMKSSINAGKKTLAGLSIAFDGLRPMAMKQIAFVYQCELK